MTAPSTLNLNPPNVQPVATSALHYELPTLETQDDCYYRARDDWSAQVSVCLSISKGDLVKISEKGQDGKLNQLIDRRTF